MEVDNIKIEICKGLTYANAIPMTDDESINSYSMVVSAIINNVTLLNQNVGNVLREKVAEYKKDLFKALRNFRPSKVFVSDSIREEFETTKFKSVVYTEYRDDVNQMLSSVLAEYEIIP